MSMDPWFPLVCLVCNERLFEDSSDCSKKMDSVVATSCHHILHSSCGNISKSTIKGTLCPVCKVECCSWGMSKDPAYFREFWISKIEKSLRQSGPLVSYGKKRPLPAETIRNNLWHDASFNQNHKGFIFEPNCGLQGALQWAGSTDYNNRKIISPVVVTRTDYKNNKITSPMLITRGLWKYDRTSDDLWLWEWGDLHPRQRCTTCKRRTDVYRPLVPCEGCAESKKGAYYCGDKCREKDLPTHKEQCTIFAQYGPDRVDGEDAGPCCLLL